VIRIRANYPNGAFSDGKPNSTLPENAIAERIESDLSNVLTKSVSFLQDSPRDKPHGAASAGTSPYKARSDPVILSERFLDYVFRIDRRRFSILWALCGSD
jgi:hypothetical protein